MIGSIQLEAAEQIQKLNPKLINDFEKKYNRILNAGLKANPPPQVPKVKKCGKIKNTQNEEFAGKVKKIR